MALTPGQLEVVYGNPLFASLSVETAEAFAGSCGVRNYPAGRRIFGPSEKADRFFLVLDGRVKVYKLSTNGKEQILHSYGPGKTFGEAAVWVGGTYPAFSEALTDAKLLVVSRVNMLTALRRDPELAVGMIAGLSQKLHEFERLIAELSLKDVLARLAGLLLREAESAKAENFRLTETKRQLASHIGTVAETLSRALKKLEDARHISVRGAEITLLDKTALENLAEGQ